MCVFVYVAEKSNTMDKTMIFFNAAHQTFRILIEPNLS